MEVKKNSVEPRKASPSRDGWLKWLSKPTGRRSEMKKVEVKVGQVWERRNGSLFTVERIIPAGTHEGFAEYYLTTGSRPQYRGIRIERLRKTCRLIGPTPAPSSDGKEGARPNDDLQGFTESAEGFQLKKLPSESDGKEGA